MKTLEKLSKENFKVVSNEEMKMVNGGMMAPDGTKDKTEKVTASASTSGTISVDYEKHVVRD